MFPIYITVEDFTKWLMQPPEGQRLRFRNENQMNIIVAGGSNSNYCSIGGLTYFRSVQIDE